MPTTTPTQTAPLTVRDYIIQALIDKLAAITEASATDLNGYLFQNVVLGETWDIPAEGLPVVGIIESEEVTVEMLYPLVEKALKITIEFRWRPQDQLDNYHRFRYYLGRLQKVLFGTEQNLKLITDSFPQGLSTNVREDGNAPSLDGDPEQSPSGYIQIIVNYRHVDGDPYTMSP